ncbi:MAG: hypothetical protein B7X35_06460 [Halothiobacillus sp. 14-56-357]|jgi:outer membrane scaffolding protein for murein synthesis (MipA/OmpV family)|uniref:MipA/OmpV family protein n=1 Tax=Halothiobacillus sp. 15-55-196 TaxID=1970382 RepID=UPI000BDA8DD4|nr:MipA/OmpV family protein [Halothiobacillus sp. 15-55-196]OZB36307.1 MAG: hypothetical protein B7X44_06645 [Halothiobacillus sp. 15-55-196]OZB56233.1 MAG: hypothetical protein B7X35_06460 [Halothiobacillus sp. 14-56-357]OZB77794.1 MAG: hypothetical protein B7X29_07280 [Halothiobacillus sp. 13-55-115]
MNTSIHKRKGLLASVFLTLPVVTEAAPVELPRADTKSGWSVSVGAAAVVTPVYSGSDAYATSIFPDLRVRYGDRFFASIPEGIGYNLIQTPHWRVGPVIKLRFSRNEDTGGSPFLISGKSDALKGMGDISAAGEAGGYVEYRLSNWSGRVEVRQGFGGHTGVLGDLSLNYFSRVGPVRYAVGPRATLASAEFINTYYGVTAAQSMTTRYQPYTAADGLVSVGVGASAFLPLSRSWQVGVAASYDHLGSQASDSPLVRSANQMTLIGSLSYRF